MLCTAWSAVILSLDNKNATTPSTWTGAIAHNLSLLDKYFRWWVGCYYYCYSWFVVVVAFGCTFLLLLFIVYCLARMRSILIPFTILSFFCYAPHVHNVTSCIKAPWHRPSLSMNNVDANAIAAAAAKHFPISKQKQTKSNICCINDTQHRIKRCAFELDRSCCCFFLFSFSGKNTTVAGGWKLYCKDSWKCENHTRH